MKNFLKAPALALALSCACSMPTANAAELTITLEGIQSNAGKILVRLYSGKEGWLKDDGTVAKEELSLADWSEGSLVTVMDLEAGEYAISAYQDEDDDGELDSNFIGIPKEPAGMSNKPKARMGPPRYEDAAFVLPEEGLAISVKLNSN